MSNSKSASLAATSPFECLPTAELTPSGLLLLDSHDAEVELLQRHGDMLQLRSESSSLLSSHPNYKDRMDLDSIVLTTHRLVVVCSNEQRFLHLSNIHSCEVISTSVFSSHCKIRISTYSLGEFILVLPKKETILPILEKTLERRAWETASRLQESSKTAISKRRVGVDAILASQQRKHERASQLTETAFTGDVETLLREATELVTIIQKYASTLDQSSNNKKDDSHDQEKMADMLSDMGMTSSLAVSNKSNIYFETLARQVADFLLPKLQKQGLLMISLTDLYCIYNRARGSNLISPSDLLAAVETLDKISSIPLSLKTFASGVKVVVQTNNDYNADKLGKQLKDVCAEGVTALEASRLLKLSAMLAQEALLEAEKEGYLCRDVTLETTRFYTNQFPDFMLQTNSGTQ